MAIAIAGLHHNFQVYLLAATAPPGHKYRRIWVLHVAATVATLQFECHYYAGFSGLPEELSNNGGHYFQAVSLGFAALVSQLLAPSPDERPTDWLFRLPTYAT